MSFPEAALHAGGGESNLKVHPGSKSDLAGAPDSLRPSCSAHKAHKEPCAREKQPPGIGAGIGAWVLV